MYLETMSTILAPMNKIILDANVGHGVVPYLPLPGLEKRTPSVSVTEPAPSANAPQASTAPAAGAQQ
jgi:membrane protease subunit HflK